MESEDDETLRIATEWCEERGEGWSLLEELGRGGTAPVFTVRSPHGLLALKVFNRLFSSGERGQESERRLAPQLALGLHSCPYVVRIHDGGRYKERLFILMDKAPGGELEKRLHEVPRDKIGHILDQVARGVMFLREQKLCHRDLKSANIFVSDDWKQVTILDLSVLRRVDDPIGLGTDHGNQLPVVATSRYSPPEYLFRLVEAGPELWHALDIYQLGGLLHDLIMREPMFEAEYQINRDTNRYRFAWIVATQEPEIKAHDVGPDLTILARRALDKDWVRRGMLRIEDFTNESRVQQERALSAFGVKTARVREATVERLPVRIITEKAAKHVEDEIRSRLRTAGIVSEHLAKEQADGSQLITFRWGSDDIVETDVRSVTLALTLRPSTTGGNVTLSLEASLSAVVIGEKKEHLLSYPEFSDNEFDQSVIVDTAWNAFAVLAADLMRA